MILLLAYGYIWHLRCNNVNISDTTAAVETHASIYLKFLNMSYVVQIVKPPWGTFVLLGWANKTDFILRVYYRLVQIMVKNNKFSLIGNLIN